MKAFPIFATVFCAALASAAGAERAGNPFEHPVDASLRSPIDRLVFDQCERLGIQPARTCSDAVFLRRAYLDVIGTLPTPREARAFLTDRSPSKRRGLVDRLLERDEFADYRALKWSDLLRVKSEFPINLWPNAVQAYHRWIRDSIKENKPYDAFARELLTASGSNFRTPPVNFYRAVQGTEPRVIARAVALTFMGARMEHWTEKRQEGMATFFSRIGFKSTGEWKEEIVFFDSSMAASAGPDGDALEAFFPDGAAVRLPPDRDPREVFADWLIADENEWFARNIANRVWYWLLGRGIIHEPDDVRWDNPPVNAELLNWLEKQLVASEYDLKHLYRLILNSRTYQLSSIPRSDHAEAEANFAFYPPQRLDAEVLIDALCQITGSTETYSSAIPEPFTFIPEDRRSIALADGSITSSFLELFGRPPRDTGLASERNNRPSASQRLHLLNSSHIQRKIERSPKLRANLQSSRGSKEAVERLYLTLLSRFPTNRERETILAYARSGDVTQREAATDLAWALINSPEFLYRH